jgi:hypothetical protein
MKTSATVALTFLFLTATCPCSADERPSLRDSLTLHASFETGFHADFSKGEKTCYVRKGSELVPAEANEDVNIAEGAGRYGNALRFTRKSSYRPLYLGKDVLNYNEKNWSASVSVWLRLDPDKDLEPGYCDPVQIVGGDSKKGFIFLEWSRDETPRLFRYAIRPLYHIWNPDDVPWDEIPAEKRPMVQIEKAPFSSEKWTHVVFTLENINDKSKPQSGTLYLNGERMGSIENWDLTFGWDPKDVQLVLGAAYVGHLDDLAVFNRPLTDAEVKRIYGLNHGIRELYHSE